MDQHGGDFAALSRQVWELVAGNGENFDRFEGDYISWRSDEPRIRQHAGDLTCMPLEEFCRPGTTIDKQSQPAGENDVKTLDLAALPAQQLAGTQLPDGTVGG